MPSEALKELLQNYSWLNPLLIKRTLDNTKSKERSIYILNNLPDYPIVWDFVQNKWTNKNASIDKT